MILVLSFYLFYGRNVQKMMRYLREVRYKVVLISNIKIGNILTKMIEITHSLTHQIHCSTNPLNYFIQSALKTLSSYLSIIPRKSNVYIFYQLLLLNLQVGFVYVHIHINVIML